MKMPPDKTKMIGQDRVVTTLGALKARGALRALTSQQVGEHLVLRSTSGRVAYTSRRLTPDRALDMLIARGGQPLRDSDFDAQGFVAPHPTSLGLLQPGNRPYRGDVIAAALRNPDSTLKFHLWRSGHRADLSHFHDVVSADFAVVHVDRLEIVFNVEGTIVFTQTLDDLEEATFQHGPVSLLLGCRAVVQQYHAFNVATIRYLNPGADPKACRDATHYVGLCGCFALGPGLPVMPQGGVDVTKLAKVPWDR